MVRNYPFWNLLHGNFVTIGNFLAIGRAFLPVGTFFLGILSLLSLENESLGRTFSRFVMHISISRISTTKSMPLFFREYETFQFGFVWKFLTVTELIFGIFDLVLKHKNEWKSYTAKEWSAYSIYLDHYIDSISSDYPFMYLVEYETDLHVCQSFFHLVTDVVRLRDIYCRLLPSAWKSCCHIPSTFSLPVYQKQLFIPFPTNESGLITSSFSTSTAFYTFYQLATVMISNNL